MLELVDAQIEGGRSALRNNVYTGITSWPGVSVQVEESLGGGCSVFGAYDPKQDSALIRVVTSSKPRMRFTALHELGHHLQQTDLQLAMRLAEQGDKGWTLEEAACDAFAAEILLPAREVEVTLGSGNPSAVDLTRLWRRSEASRAAVCTAGWQRLETDGIVGLIRGDGVVEFSRTRGLPPLGRDSDQHTGELAANIARSQLSDVVQGKTRLMYRGGTIRGADELWVQAAWAGDDYWMFVGATQSVPWEKLSLPSIQSAVAGYWWTCELCGHLWEVFEPKHAVCGHPVCEECSRCGCVLNRPEKQCTECFLVKSAALFADGSDVCKDCTN